MIKNLVNGTIVVDLHNTPLLDSSSYKDGMHAHAIDDNASKQNKQMEEVE